MENKQPILSICIPIYNRLNYLEKMLARFTEDKELFEEQIHLFISDNCSEDDLRTCCEKYQKQGLKLEYHRNDENIGPDKNFELCFAKGKGKYTWLLGSDDIPRQGVISTILQALHKDGEFGLIHLKMRARKDDIQIFHDSDTMIEGVNYWITYMSSNIILSKNIVSFDLERYRGSYLIQVPMYLYSCGKCKDNVILSIKKPFEDDNDVENNGGFNFFKVFVENLYRIMLEFVDKGMFSHTAFEKVKKIEFKEHLAPHVVTCLLLKTNKNYDNTNAWKILKHHYRGKKYVPICVSISLVKWVIKKIIGRE